MKPFTRTALVFSFCTAILGGSMPAYAQHQSAHAATAIPATKIDQTSAALRDLWIGHVFWVRNVVLERLAGNKAAVTVAENEAVANAKQIAAAIEPFYGKAASDKLFTLLAGHYGAVKQYLDASIAKSKAKQDAATKALTTNADEIASFLASANPNFPVDALRGLLLAHGGHHMQQIQQLRDKNYAEEAKTWSAMKDHMYVIADALTDGLAKQFPDKFK
ncbi:MAG TPA: hypothetical protein VHK70_06635 [Burkholderiaceae bacterium]|nr:hypothetical protein [Burkholderiaceae bacterium]